ncbi:MAG: prolyl oligopeptidase family serine peptidase [Pseudomonadota bacterium]
MSLTAISPSGKRIAYRRTTGDRDDVLVLDLESRKIVGGVGVQEHRPKELIFVDDDNVIANTQLSRNKLTRRGPFRPSAAFHYKVSTGELTRLLTRAEHLYAAQANIGRIIGVTEQGKRLLMPAFHHADELLHRARYGVYSVNLSNNQAELIETGTESTVDWFTDGNGAILARAEYYERNDLYQVVSERKPGQVLYQSENKLPLAAAVDVMPSVVRGDSFHGAFQGVSERKPEQVRHQSESKLPPAGAVGVMPSGDALVVLARNDVDDVWSIYSLDVSTGELAGPLLGQAGSSAEWIQHDLNRVVHGIVNSGFVPKHAFFDKAFQARFERITQRLAGTFPLLLSFSDDMQHLVVHVSGGWNSGLYYLVSGEEDPVTLAAERPDIPSEQVAPTQLVHYDARDGLKIPALVTATPAVREAGKAPLIVMPHSIHESFEHLQFDWMPQYFASRGYVVLQPQFRGSRGYGAELTRAGFGEWGGKMQTDLDDGVDYLVASGLADAGRVCIVGAKYGGYAALAAGAFSPDKYHCIASIGGVSDLRHILKKQPKTHHEHHWLRAYWERQFSKGRFDWKLLDSLSPAKHARKFEAPVLLIHGERDASVPVDQSKTMRKALKKAGKEVTLVELETEDPLETDDGSRLKTLRALARFVDASLQPQ